MRIRQYTDRWYSTPKLIAQDCLRGRSYYVEDDTLRYHKSRILDAGIEASGLLFTIVESYAVDYGNTSRLYRGVVFDMFGGVVYREGLEDGYTTSKKARSAMKVALADLDALAINKEAFINYQQGTEYERQEIVKILEGNE